MKTKILVLENDIEHQGLPDVLQEIVEENDEYDFDIWWWFGEDVKQNTEKSFKRFAEASKNNILCISYPSFVGYGNSFDSKLFLFTKLMEQGIKLKLGICYYPDFFWFLVKWANDINKSYKTKKEKLTTINLLKKNLEFHEIYNINWSDAYMSKTKLHDNLTRLNWDSLSKYIFESDEIVKVKATGEKKELRYIYINIDKPFESTVALDNGTNSYSSDEDITLAEIEKITKKRS